MLFKGDAGSSGVASQREFKTPKLMQKVPLITPKGGLNVQDVMFVLFKHKWKILMISLLGFGAAAAVFMSQPPIFQSQSKLLVRYVIERGSVEPYESQSSPGGKAGSDVINTEIEILTSVDLALTVAEKIGVDKLMPEAEGKATLSDVANRILGELEVGAGQSSNILHVVYGNPDPELAKEVLRELIDRYFEKHLEIHRSAAAFDMVARQTEEVRERLKQTEGKLDKLRSDSGILSLDDATRALSSQRSQTQEDLMKAKGDLAELQASIAAVVTDRAAEAEPAGKPRTGAARATTTGKTHKEVSALPPPQAITEYRAVMDLLAFLQKRNLELRIKFKAGNHLLVLNQQQLDAYDEKRRLLIEKYPELAAEAVVLEKGNDSQNPRWNLLNEKARLAALMAKIEVYEMHLKEIGAQFSKQYAIGAQIEEMDRRKQMEDAEYRTLEANLKKAKIDLTLDPSRMPNITVVQQPTEPIRTYNRKIKKLILGLAGGGVAAGVGLAFLIELLLDRRIKRPIEIQTRLQLPLLLAIPYIRRKDRDGRLLANRQMPSRIGMGEELAFQRFDGGGRLGSVDSVRQADHFILPYSETIRDRIIFNFEINNMTHKPKLVAVTGLSEGAGTSTIAAGMAKSFSEIRGMKVLLVDLSSYHSEENVLFGAIPRHSLDGALQLARSSRFRENAQNLYYASATARRDHGGLTTFSPVHLNELMPNLQASEFDYIIFDMPPIDQTSRSLTMAGMMDKVLLVLDAENTNRDRLMWGYGELVKGRADVSCVFNKSRTSSPDWHNS